MEQIPKIIHWCWFGPKKPPRLVRKCLASWRAHLPDYQIIRWNETNFDLNSNLYVKEAYAAKKYAFVSDYVRLWALYQMGGIYLDSDVEVIKSLDVFLTEAMFIGYEPGNLIATCIIGAKPKHPWLTEWLKDYETRKFDLGGQNFDLTPNTFRVTELMKSRGFRPSERCNSQFFYQDAVVTIYSNEYFPPKSYLYQLKEKKKRYAIHHLKASWKPSSEKTIRKIAWFFQRFLPMNQYIALRKIWRSIIRKPD